VLEQLRERGAAWRPLEGKILALISASNETEEAQRFHRAAAMLGARVAWMRPSLTLDSSPELIRATSRVLGKLYDAIVCQGVDEALACAIGEAAGIPVFELQADVEPADEAREYEQGLLFEARLLHALT